MPASVWRLALALTVTTTSCSLLSTDELQEGAAATSTGGATTSTAAGPGPAPSSSAAGDGGDGSGAGSSDGGSTSTATSTGDGGAGGGAGGGGPGGAGPVGPCGEPSTYADIVLGDDPIAYFRMGADVASLSIDSADNPHDATRHGSLTSVVSPLGPLGGCAMHADTLKGDPAQLAWVPPDSAVFGDAGAFSLEMWFSVDELPETGSARFLFAREYGEDIRFHLYVTAGGALYWFFDLDGFRQLGFDDANIVPGALHHVVAIRAGAPGTVSEIVDGDEVATDLTFFYDGRRRLGVNGGGVAPLEGADDAPLTMPGTADYAQPADGTFDEVAIYDRVLTQDEVRSHFCAIIDDGAICP